MNIHRYIFFFLLEIILEVKEPESEELATVLLDFSVLSLSLLCFFMSLETEWMMIRSDFCGVLADRRDKIEGDRR